MDKIEDVMRYVIGIPIGIIVGLAFLGLIAYVIYIMYELVCLLF